MVTHIQLSNSQKAKSYIQSTYNIIAKELNTNSPKTKVVTTLLSAAV